MDQTVLRNAVARLPPGNWGVGVSGGADSVALLLLLRDRSDLSLHVVHLDHETRDGESAADAQFVANLAATMGVDCTIERRSVVEKSMTRIAQNPANRFRLARLALFRRVVDTHQLSGVVLAHHADDQAETVLMRILRGCGAENLVGIRPTSFMAGLRLEHPLLEVPGAWLRDWLVSRGQCWCEDASNQSDQYQRNRVRQWLASQPLLRDGMIQLGRDSAALKQWIDRAAPTIARRFRIEALGDLPGPLARHAVVRWLIDRGMPPAEISGKVCDRLIEMAKDAASPPRQHFPGGLLVRRQGGEIFVDKANSET